MPEYIERAKAIKELGDVYEYEYPTASGAFDKFATTIVPNVLKNLPTADVVEVVRCCDCEHKQENPDINNTCYLTCNLKYGIRGTIDPTDFCSYGERKEVKDA
jgi:hypothetical protein